MNLIDILKRYIRKNDSGLLSIKIEGDSHLLKIYFERGEVVSISLGGCKDEECLKRLNKVIPVEHSFIKGVKPPARADSPMTERLMELLGIPFFDSGPEARATGRDIAIQPQTVAAVEEDFIDTIGPIGKMIVDNIFSEISYRRGNPMAEGDYSIFLDTILKELPSRQRSLFNEKYRMETEE